MDIKSFLEAKSPALLIAGGIIGFGFTIVMTARLAPKAKRRLDGLGDASLKEKVIEVAPIYAPVLATGLISAGCILTGTKIISNRFASIAMLYALSERQIAKLQQAIIDEVGPEKAEFIRRNTTRPEGDVPPELDYEQGGTLFFDGHTGRYFRKPTVETIRRIVNDMNELIIGEGWATVNEFYDLLDLPHIDNGDNKGWSPEGGLLDITYDAFLRYDRDPVVSLSFKVEPKYWKAY